MSISPENYQRYLNDVPYDLLVPPFGPIHKLTPKKAQLYFEWFLEHIPERMEYFRNRCASDLGIPVSQLDYSLESMKPVWKWFLQTARTEMPTGEELEQQQKRAALLGPSCIHEVFTVATEFIIRDIGMYVSQFWMRNYKGLEWTYYTKPKSDVHVNQAIITGFLYPSSNPSNPPSIMQFEPNHMVYVQAAKLLLHEESIADLHKVCAQWVRYAPEKVKQ